MPVSKKKEQLNIAASWAGAKRAPMWKKTHIHNALESFGYERSEARANFLYDLSLFIAQDTNTNFDSMLSNVLDVVQCISKGNLDGIPDDVYSDIKRVLDTGIYSDSLKAELQQTTNANAVAMQAGVVQSKNGFRNNRG